MSVQAEVVLTTARTLLNDDAATLWTDTVLFPKLAQAHRELQVMLRFHGSPVMMGMLGDTEVVAAATTLTLPSDLVEPIKLWERAFGDANQADNVLMTEASPLPFVAQGTALVYWNWYQETITFVGSSANRYVNMQYWRSIPIPTVNTALIGFINGELFLAPRIAALAAGSVGNAAVLQYCTGLANDSLNQVILSNRGRLKPADGMISRP